MRKKIALIIPTYNAMSADFESVLSSINKSDTLIDYKLIIDSESKDNTVDIARKYGFDVISINKRDFNHGLTRDYAIKSLYKKDKDIDYIVMMTQDALLQDSSSLSKLIDGFKLDNEISATYGRQLTTGKSSLLERVSRKFNYPERSILKSKSDIKELGLNTPFLSDSYSAYNMKDYLTVGGFQKSDFGEDMLIGARLIISGKKIYYNAEATVTHSHSYSIRSEYERGKAIAKMHKENAFLISTFGKAEDRGFKMILSERFYLIPLLILEALPKFIGYKVSEKII